MFFHGTTNYLVKDKQFYEFKFLLSISVMVLIFEGTTIGMCCYEGPHFLCVPQLRIDYSVTKTLWLLRLGCFQLVSSY